MRQSIFFIIALIIFVVPAGYADVVLDGSLGSAEDLTGPYFKIPAAAGQQRDANLFHSFLRFDLDRTETAAFYGSESIRNIISRVTGGQPSSIDGGIQVTIPEADFYFLNPAGILFGPNAWLDVSGSLYFSTADYLALGEEGRFDAVTPENSRISIAPPAAFGFLDNKPPAEIAVEGSRLFLANGENRDKLALAGGDINIRNGMLITSGNDVYLVSAASDGEAPVDPAGLTDDTFAEWGNIRITDTRPDEERVADPADLTSQAGNVDAGGSGGGRIYIRAGNVFMDNGWVWADTLGNGSGRGIAMHVHDSLEMNNKATISAVTVGQGEGGDIRIQADSLMMEDLGLIDSSTYGDGNAGGLSVEAGTLALTGDAVISINAGDRYSDKNATGNAGNLSISAEESVLLNGFSAVTGNVFTSGQGGTIEISAPLISVENHAGIQAATEGSGNAGKMMLKADRLILKDYGRISAYTVENGNAGELTVEAGTLELTENAVINVNTGYGDSDKDMAGNAGNLSISAKESVLLSGSGGIAGNVFTRGQGGKMEISAPRISIEDGARIQTATQGAGDAGQILLETESLEVSGGNILAITTDAGDAGDLTVEAGTVKLTDAQIGVNTGSWFT
ncbi:MAG: filamentous hemagglutinin N-terminal domain-containing protein [Gammaproteobacteria bacterium]|nr:filamentous hemagglutinin N-terminal domain-containing protein [Gammaproteobacteria bacterium]